MTSMDAPVIIVGGGIAGLACARCLNAWGVRGQVLEATGRVGGRIKTDRKDGYLLDRAVIVATEAPETERLLGLARTTASVAETCLYFSSDSANWQPSFLMLIRIGGIMDVLKRVLAPVPQQVWAEIEAQAARSLKAILSARKVIGLTGPMGPDFPGVPG